MRIDVVKVVKIATTVGSLALTLASSWVGNKTMKEEIAKEVAKQINNK